MGWLSELFCGEPGSWVHFIWFVQKGRVGVGGSVKKGWYVGGVLPFIIVGVGHFWGWAALLFCIGA